jgi:DNA modification methylase
MNQIIFGDCVETMKDLISKGVKVQTCVTSPPYFGLRDYGVDGQIGLEETPQAYVDKMVEVFRCVKDLLADDGTLWLNLGDSYFSTTKGSGGSNPENSPFQNRKGKNNFQGFETRKFSAGNISCKPKDLIGIPWRVALALQADGWYLRQDIIWAKPNPMPESVTDRCTKSHEYIFLMSKNPKYYFDHEAIKEPCAESSYKRWNQDIENQVGSNRVPGKTNGNMKAVGIPTKIRFGGNEYGDSDDPKHATKSGNCYVDTGTRNKRSVWTQTVKPYKGAHFATFPTQLIEPCVLAGSRIDDIVFDPFMGSGTTAQVAIENGRQYLGCELNPEYKNLQDERIAKAHGIKKTPLPMG